MMVAYRGVVDAYAVHAGLHLAERVLAVHALEVLVADACEVIASGRI